MSEEFDFSTGMPSSEMAQYLQLFLDETSEQLDALVESLLVLENHPTDTGQLNEAFRLIHSIKGSSGMMGLDGITVLTHHLENHFERLRSGLVELDQTAMGLILRCIDFLRECNRRLRTGEALGSAPDLLDELNLLSAGPQAAPLRPAGESPAAAGPAASVPVPPVTMDTPAASADPAAATGGPEPETAAPVREYRVDVRFEPDLPLVDLKAELVLARLADMGAIHETRPARSEIESHAALQRLQVLLATDRSPAQLRIAADVDGVDLIEIEEGVTRFAAPDSVPLVAETTAVAAHPVAATVTAPEAPASREEPPAVGREAESDAAEEHAGAHGAAAAATPGTEAAEGRSKVVETVRVDIDRLDNLMNLAGELVVNKARFVQIARQMSPAFKKSSLSGRARAFGESMRRALQLMKSQANGGDGGQIVNWGEQFHELESEIDALEEQSRLWEDSRRCFGQITEAIDQMTRVSDSLQRGVLDTRMVPVAPLFNRFKRVVRDIALELGKKVNLEIHGEKTELDKRMIDELGDPLVHLIRNAIDHGIEPADVRLRRGKPEIGTIALEAAHSGNNVFISVRDDGGGISAEKVRQRIVERGLLSAAVAEGLSEQDVIEFIWHPGFSTADVVSDISGRGVGMDIVKTRIAELNGTIDIQQGTGRGTTFTIRLPLTLAIIRSLLFRLRHGIFAVPIDNVREIVSVPVDQIVTVHGKQTFDVRGQFIPLVDIDDIFDWHQMRYRYPGDREVADESEAKRVNVVILHSADKTMGLRVNELHGGQDIVIKSLAENFIHVRGLSGASILGDGSVCLLLDVGAAIGMATDARRKVQMSA
ncbi:MAG: chemotaxis protein CheW [Planctomycetales bacterium]